MTRVGALPPSAYTEAMWQHQVEQLLDVYGWDYRYHVGRTKYAPWGWPDIVAVRRRDRRLLFAELKTADGKAMPDQLALLELLMDVAYVYQYQVDGEPSPRIDVALWRPGDVDEVVRVLR